jgi:hypothetical protein
MSEIHRVYLDQMLRIEVGQALQKEGHDVLRAAEVGQDRADDDQIGNVGYRIEQRLANTIVTAFFCFVLLSDQFMPF